MEPILFQGDCLAILAELEPDSVDAVITDPPYGIGFMGREWDTFRPAAARKRRETAVQRAPIDSDNPNLRGRTRSPSISSSQIEYDMSRRGLHRFERWCAEWGAGCFRVLKPGGYLISFGAPRAYHRLACGIEDAGFEVRDALDWIFGTGFPKSIDGEREVARALCKEEGRHFLRKLPREEKDRRPGDHVCQATPESLAFLGVGAALKPAHEPILLARKPFQGTIGANLFTYGTGGIYVDATRGTVPPPSVPQPAPAFNSPTGRTYGMQTGEGRNGEMSESSGRWPPNLVLSHLPDCRPAGRVRVRSTAHYPTARGAGWISTDGHAGQQGLPERAVDFEDVEGWLCVDGCPVALLDEQSGQSRTPDSVTRGSSSRRNTFNIQSGPELLEVPSYGDAGGASRYFPIFRYEPKPDRAERDLGCEDLEARTGGQATHRQDGHAGVENARAGAGRTGGARNFHPTVKPIGLMRWLIRLVAAPGQTVLDPFLGSGSTGMAAKLEGVRFIGIEREAEYLAIARRRIEATHRAAILDLADGIGFEEERPEDQAPLNFDESGETERSA